MLCNYNRETVTMYHMNIIVGLGNPGSVYINTRHNVGFEVIKSLGNILKCPDFSVKKKMKSEVCKHGQNVFAVPLTFMNGSGFAVKSIVDYYLKNKSNYENLYVVHDDLDLPLGQYKIMFGTGPALHNGLLSIYQHLGTKNFWHVRVGIDTREGNRTIEPASYVLQRFTPEEKERFKAIKLEIVNELTRLIN